MSEKDFYGMSGSTKGGHSKLRGQPLQSHVSAWRMCVQIVYGDLDRLNGGRGSSVHFVWATELNKIGRCKAQQTAPYIYQCSHPIFYSLPSREPVQDVAHIGRVHVTVELPL